MCDINTLLLNFEEEHKEIKSNEGSLSCIHDMWQSVTKYHEVADL